MQSQIQIQTSSDIPDKNIPKNSLFFVIFALLWQTAAIIIIGLFLGYDQSINESATTFFYNQYLNIYLIMAFLIFLMAGLTLTSAYVTFSSSINMTFSILVSVFTLQNWFIFRCFWHKTGLPLAPMASSFDGQRYDSIAFLPSGNFRGLGADYGVATASFYDAIGACIAMFCALTPLLGRIGFLEVFFLSWVGPFFYQINSSIFNKFYIVDTGFGMRGFLFGGLLGLFISLIIGRKQESKTQGRFMSHYHINALGLIGCVLICLTFPSLVSTGLQYYTKNLGTTLAAVAQINMWFSLGGSVVGVFIANSLNFRKISVHDVIFVSLAGSIAYSSSCAINFNPGAACAIGSGIGLICALIHTPFKRWMNTLGVLESNSVIVQFIIPGTFACVFSSILQAVNQGNFNISLTDSIVINTKLQDFPDRSPSGQAGWQLIGFAFSLGSSLICGVILGILFKCTHKHRPYWYFNDWRAIDFGGDKKIDDKRRSVD